MLRRHFMPLLAAGLLLAATSTAQAWLRPRYEDAQVVERSTLIVVAHLKPGSLLYVPVNVGGGQAWNYHATLVITQTLKGKAEAKEIPITLFYGIDAEVEGRVQHDDRGQQRGTFAKGSIQFIDYADGESEICADATLDNLWLLQKRAGYRGEKVDEGDYGIADPDEIQPLALLDYYKCYLAADPEGAVKAYLEKHADTADRGKRYLEHMEVQRAAQIKDPTERVAKLLPFFTQRFYWGMKDEVNDALVAAGADAAGPALLKLFNDPAHADRRGDIMNAWAAMGYKGCVGTLIALLNSDDQYWATQKLEAGWWNKDVDSELTQERQRHYGDLVAAVRILGILRDSRARDALEMTLARWRDVPFDDQMASAALASLKALPDPK